MPPPGGLTALASFLMTGEKSSLVAVAAPAPNLVAAPPKEAPKPLVSAKDKPPEAGKSKTLGWVAFGTGVGAVVLGGVAIYEGAKSNSAYSDAESMLDPATGTVKPPYTVAEYNSKVSDGQSAQQIATATGVGAGVCVISTAVLGYLSYKQTGEIGPFRF
jgi:hypothetical protein